MNVCKTCGVAVPVGRVYCDNTCYKNDRKMFDRRPHDARNESRRLDRLTNDSRRTSAFSTRKTGI